MSAISPSLPIDAVLPDLLITLGAGPSAILVAPPGAGKSTRVPLALIEADWRKGRRIIMLEPRRVAARAAARQMARLRGEDVGGAVGYRVRLDSRTSARTVVEVVTEGVFTRQILADPELTGVAAVIFDEFHERSLDADFGLALALDARALRPDLRLLVMSATLDAANLSKLLGDCPVIESQGRSSTVDTRYRPQPPQLPIDDAMSGVILEALHREDGSVLAFLPGLTEIRRTAERLSGRLPHNCDMAMLHGQLRAADQDEALRPSASGRRKLVLATAVAQTSLTIEDVTIVVDSGLSRLPAYDPATGLTRLVTRRVTRATADQRRGRAGRTAPGICYRLWPENQALRPFDPPEIVEADLAGLVLDCASWGIVDPSALTFPTQPPRPAWKEARALLHRLGAVDAAGRITPDGRLLARLPLHPRLAHMIGVGARHGAVDLACELAVLLSERGLGGEAIDIATRLESFRHDHSPRAREAHELARRWARLIDAADKDRSPSIGRLLAAGYPDRVAQRTAPGRFRLENGRGARCALSDSLAMADFVVIAEVTGEAGEGRIRAAARIDIEDIREAFTDHLDLTTITTFDAASGTVRTRQALGLGALRIGEIPIPAPADAQTANLLAQAAAQTGIDRLGWSRTQMQWRRRASFLNRTMGAEWPDLSERGLAGTVETWLAPFLLGQTRLAEIDADVLEAALSQMLPHRMRREIEDLLPSHFEASTGTRVPIDYDVENGPAISVRVQELFGLGTHPSIAKGRIPLLVVLLSPAHRPIQTTRDLPGFWRGSWKEVAKDLKGRYPRHPWPDDPLVAPPTNRAKPRGR